MEIDAVPKPGKSTIARPIVEIAHAREGPICWVSASMRRKAGDP